MLLILHRPTQEPPLTDSTSQELKASEDQGSNTSKNPALGDIIAARLNRRDFARGALAITAIGGFAREQGIAAGTVAQVRTFAFDELGAGTDANHHVAPGYEADVLIRWGDKVTSGAPSFDPSRQSADAQAQQFGYNNDFLGYLPIEGRSDRGLLVVNHEYTIEELMFPGIDRQDKEARFSAMTADLVAIEMAAHGGSVLELERVDGKWRVVDGSKYARRITALTDMRISGPAAGHEKMRTNADPSGMHVLGMLNNCAGAVTPWGTWLTCEENINGYFMPKSAVAAHPGAAALKRYGIPVEWYGWAKFHDRFDIAKEPNEFKPLRLGGRNRSFRSQFNPRQTNRTRPLQTRRRRQHRE